MQIIVNKENNVVKYVFENTDLIIIGSGMTTVVSDVGKPVMSINDMNRSNAEFVSVDLPEGETIETFVGDKYLYVEGQWLHNPDYIPYIEEPVEEVL